MVVTNADKGGNLRNVKDYISDAQRQHKQEEFYKRIVNNPT